jgi:hypothetical protein
MYKNITIKPLYADLKTIEIGHNNLKKQMFMALDSSTSSYVNLGKL